LQKSTFEVEICHGFEIFLFSRENRGISHCRIARGVAGKAGKLYGGNGEAAVVMLPCRDGIRVGRRGVFAGAHRASGAACDGHGAIAREREEERRLGSITSGFKVGKPTKRVLHVHFKQDTRRTQVFARCALRGFSAAAGHRECIRRAENMTEPRSQSAPLCVYVCAPA